MITTATPQEEVDALRERVADLESQLARQAQTVLAWQENEERLQAVLNKLRAAPYRRNLRTDSYDYLSPVIETLTGWSVEELTQADGETVLSWIHPEDLPRVRQEIERTSRLCREVGRATGSLEYRFRTKAGEYCWLGDDLTVLAGEDGQPLYRLGVVRDITERKLAEAELQASSESFNALFFNNAPLQGVIYRLLHDPQGEIVDWEIRAINPLGAASLGQPAEALVGQRASALFGEAVFSPYLTLSRQVAATGQPRLFETHFETNGRDYLSSVFMVGTEYYANVGVDITERKQVERELNIALEKYRVLFETFPLGISITDAAGNLIELNRESERLLGLSREDHLRRTYDGPEWRIVRPDEMPMPPDEYASVRALREKCLVENVEMGIVKDEGEITWISVTAAPIPLEGYGVAITYGDITKRKRAEAALRESEERFRLFMDNSPMTAWMQDDQSRYVYLNRTYEKRFGVRLDQWRGKSIFEIWPAEVAEQFEKSNQQVLAAGHLLNFTQTIPNPAGGESTWWIFKFPFQAASGQRYVAGIGLDITERRQIEDALYLTRYSLERVTDAIYWLDEAGRIVDVNETACRMLGYSREELLRGSVFDLDEGTTPELWREYWRQLKQAGVWQGAVTHRTKAGQRLPVEVMANYIEFGERVLNCSFVRDISERQVAEEERAKLEEQLRQAQKMESIGRLAGGVAHDFNNLLTVILGYSDLVQARLPLGSSALDQVEQIRRSAKRAEDLTRQLLAFSRKQILVPVVLDLSELVGNLRQILARLIGEDIALTTVLQPDLGAVEADPGQLEQVILNLVVNARDAMPAGGRLSLETAQVAPEDPFIQTHPEALTKPWVRLTVTDTGHGMDEATQSQIFEPFFTTKAQGKGTGLGLATVYGIVKQSGGEITVESRPGQGASFTIYLPAHQTEGVSSPEAEPEPVARSGRETILLVEDEAVVRDFVRTVLAEYGYTLLEAEHGYQALALAQQEKRLDLLLTDVVMPNIGGWELAERIRALHPGLRVLFMSGYTDDEVIRHGVRKAEVEFLTKPFSPVTLAATVRALLDK